MSEEVRTATVVPEDMPKNAGSYVQLHLDMVVQPGREAEMVSNYKKIFEPAISQQPGFVAVRLLKLRSTIIGKAPENAQYRLLITFETEEQRLEWVARDIHQEVWPTVGNTAQEINAYLYDRV